MVRDDQLFQEVPMFCSIEEPLRAVHAKMARLGYFRKSWCSGCKNKALRGVYRQIHHLVARVVKRHEGTPEILKLREYLQKKTQPGFEKVWISGIEDGKKFRLEF